MYNLLKMLKKQGIYNSQLNLLTKEDTSLKEEGTVKKGEISHKRKVTRAMQLSMVK